MSGLFTHRGLGGLTKQRLAAESSQSDRTVAISDGPACRLIVPGCMRHGA